MNVFIVRHGNTFLQGEEPRRVGIKTDLPLVDTGRVQAGELGNYFKKSGIQFDVVYCSYLKRTKETAEIILSYIESKQGIQENSLFNEIDHGEDEGKIESEVIKRIGIESINQWDRFAVEPDGWSVDYENRVNGWKKFFRNHQNCKNILVVTSNGSARFALLALNAKVSLANYKLSTGAFGLLEENSLGILDVKLWNYRPE